MDNLSHSLTGLALSRAGLNRFSPHATTLLLAGVPVHVVAARLGHADPSITLRVYAHVISDQLTEAADIFARAVAAPLLANMTEFGKSPNLDFAVLAGMGYRMVLYPLTAFRAALRAAQDTLAELKQAGHQRDRIPQMLTRAELYDLLNYSDYEEDRKARLGAEAEVPHRIKYRQLTRA